MEVGGDWTVPSLQACFVTLFGHRAGMKKPEEEHEEKAVNPRKFDYAPGDRDLVEMLERDILDSDPQVRTQRARACGGSCLSAHAAWCRCRGTQSLV